MNCQKLLSVISIQIDIKNTISWVNKIADFQFQKFAVNKIIAINKNFSIEFLKLN